MLPDTRFLNQPTRFWATVRAISEQIGYAHEPVSVTTLVDKLEYVEVRLNVKPIEGLPMGCRISNRDGKFWIAYRGLMDETARDGLLLIDDANRKGWKKAINSLYKQSTARAWIDAASLFTVDSAPTDLGALLCEYLNFRQERLAEIKPLLMNKARAISTFDSVRKQVGSNLPVPKNKQKDDKAGPAYFTGIVHVLVDAHITGHTCDLDPQSLCTFLRDGTPILTMARRLDGAFPSTVNPIAVWEIKEYYNTTSFGSRVAGGVYETTLDGMELKELFDTEGIKCQHYVFVDGYETWWDMGRSYLCRFIDLLHMGYVDEVIVGAEIVDRVPKLAQEWVDQIKGIRIR